MRIVVADTGPLNYLILIGEIDLLPALFEAVHVPDVVRVELLDEGAAEGVQDWALTPPDWLVVEPTPEPLPPLPRLDPGERAAIALAAQLKADLLLIDDRAAVAVARANGFTVTGTLGILSRAAEASYVDLPAALGRLIATSFHVRPDLIEALLSRYSKT